MQINTFSRKKSLCRRAGPLSAQSVGSCEQPSSSQHASSESNEIERYKKKDVTCERFYSHQTTLGGTFSPTHMEDVTIQVLY